MDSTNAGTRKTRRSRRLGIAVLAAVVALSPLAPLAGEELDPSPFRTSPLAGSEDDLGRFTGQWFDLDGQLVAVVRSGREPRFSVKLLEEWTGPLYSIEGARVSSDELTFHLRTSWSEERLLLALELTGQDEAVLYHRFQAPPGFFICGTFLFQDTRLVRDPSALWFMELHARRVRYRVQETFTGSYHATLYWLSEIL